MLRIGLFLSLITLLLSAHAQTKLPLRVSVFNESTSIPFSKGITAPIHPGVEMGTEFNLKESAHFILYPCVIVGYLYHRYLYQAFFIKGALGFDFKFDFGLNIKTSLGAG